MMSGGVTADRFVFGTLSDGRVVGAVTLRNAAGVAATVIAWGATLQSVILPDASGVFADVAPGYDDLDGYLENPSYFGSTIGRFANRIAGGRFTIDGETYRVPCNNGANALHGGNAGFDKALWQIVSVQSGDTAASVSLRHVSPDGDQGFPGTLTVDASYTLDANNCLRIEYRAITDRATIVSITNHAYWNLSGAQATHDAMDHVLTIHADHFLPTDADAIPLGTLHPVAGTPFDFREPRVIGSGLRNASDPQLTLANGYDHNWVLSRDAVADERLVARLDDPRSGRSVELWSNQPGLQFYSGNFLGGDRPGKGGCCYRARDAIALEPQLFPDSPNRPDFTDARLDPGEVYRNVMTWRFTPSSFPPRR